MIPVPNSDNIEDLKAAIANKEALIICGGGVSRAVAGSDAKDWKGLIEAAIEAVPKQSTDEWKTLCLANLKSGDPDIWLSTAGIIQKKLGGYSGKDYRAWLKTSVGKLQPNFTDILSAIMALKCSVATTNYDTLIASYFGVQHKTWLNPDSVAEILKEHSRNIWHIHGVWDEPESVIFSELDYTRVSTNEKAQFLQQFSAFNGRLVFIGCSADGLADENIGRLLDWFGECWTGLSKKHFALVRERET